MSARNDRKRKRPKSYYVKSAKQTRGGGKQTLTVGIKGFLLTCNFREKDTVREAYNLLNQYADEMYGPEEGFLKEKHGDEGSEDEEEDMEAALKKEVQEMKDVKPKDRRFQVVDTGAKNCIFVRTTVEDPVKMVHKIMSDVYESKKSKVRHIQRMLPISHTCKSYKDDINTLMPTILQPHLDKYPGGHPSYCVMFKVRNNNSVGRSDVYEVVGDIMMDCQVDTVDPDIVVIVEVIKTVCCVGVVTDYFKFRKFNMHEIVERTVDKVVATEKTDTGVEGKDGKAAEKVDRGADVVVDGDEGGHGEDGEAVDGDSGKVDGDEAKVKVLDGDSGKVDGDEATVKILDGDSGKVGGDGDSGKVDGDEAKVEMLEEESVKVDGDQAKVEMLDGETGKVHGNGESGKVDGD